MTLSANVSSRSLVSHFYVTDIQKLLIVDNSVVHDNVYYLLRYINIFLEGKKKN